MMLPGFIIVAVGIVAFRSGYLRTSMCLMTVGAVVAGVEMA